METRLERKLGPPADASAGTEHEPDFLLVRDYSGDWPRWKRAAMGSAAFHLVAITALFLIKSGPSEPPPPERTHVPYVVHLYVPKELTQKAPNKGPVAKLLLTPPAAPAPAPKLATPAPQLTKAATPQPPAPVVTPPPPPPPVVTPPAPAPGETARTQPPASTPPPVAVPKPDAPKMLVEDSLQAHPPAPKPGGSLIPLPSNSVQEAMRALSNGGAPASRTRIGDSADTSVGASLHLAPSAARLSNFQLKSDPMGVDFQPYLLQVLAAVKLNWSAVFPTAAKLGMRGLVTLEFSILKDGTVQKIVFDAQSGSIALDQASVSAISASNPLPSLPRDFKGERIVLQMSFMYNMPK